MEHARNHAELALHFSIENNEKMVQGLSMVWLGRVVAKTDTTHIDDAEQQMIQGISLLTELEIRISSCLGQLWLGEVYAEAGRHDAALKTLKTAEAMFREMGVDYWLSKAREALARLPS
jgi:predicted negative regulator of RcsB-dependent stress response